MAGRKDVLLPFQIFNSDSLQSDLTSDVITIQYLDNVAIQLGWTGNGTGTFYVEGSLNYNSREPDSAIWTALTLSPVPTVSGSADDALLDLNQLSFPLIRVSYVSTFLSGEIETIADVASSLNSKYFLLSTVDEDYYIWFSVAGMGVNPNLPNKTGIVVIFPADSSASAVAAAVKILVQSISGIERVTRDTNQIFFNISELGGSASAGNSGFTVTNVDSTGLVNGFISAKMI